MAEQTDAALDGEVALAEAPPQQVGGYLWAVQAVRNPPHLGRWRSKRFFSADEVTLLTPEEITPEIHADPWLKVTQIPDGDPVPDELVTLDGQGAIRQLGEAREAAARAGHQVEVLQYELEEARGEARRERERAVILERRIGELQTALEAAKAPAPQGTVVPGTAAGAATDPAKDK